MKIRAVFLDAGDTLLAPFPSFGEVFSRVLAQHGHDVEPSEVEGAFKEMAPGFTDIQERSGYTTWSTSRELSQEFWGSVYRVAFEYLGVEDSEGDMAKSLYERFTRFDSYRLFPDSIAALEKLKAAGLHIGLISNFEAWLEPMLEDWGIVSHFETMVISGIEGVEKPDPAIFRIALDRAGMDAGESVYVGDHPKVDFEASSGIGIRAVLIDRKGRFPEFSGERIQSLASLPNVLGLSEDPVPA